MFNNAMMLSGGKLIADVYTLSGALAIQASDPLGGANRQLSHSISNDTISTFTGLNAGAALQVLDEGEFIAGYSSASSFGDGIQLQFETNGLRIGIISSTLSGSMSPTLIFDKAAFKFSRTVVTSGSPSGSIALQIVGDSIKTGQEGFKMRVFYINDNTFGPWSEILNVFSQV